MDEESLAYLGEIGEQTSLRHAVQLLTPASILAQASARQSRPGPPLPARPPRSAIFAVVVFCSDRADFLSSFSPLPQTNGRDNISRGDVEETASLFLDAKASAKLLSEQAEKYIM